MAGRKQEAPPSQASGLPLGVSPGTPRPPGSSPTPECQSPPSGPRTPRSAHPSRRDPHLEQYREMAEQGGRASSSPSCLDEHGRPAWQAPGGAGVAGRRAEHGNAGCAWWLLGLALPVGALRAQVCSAGGDLWGRGAGRAQTGPRGPASESGGRLSYMAQHLAIPRPPPPGAVPVPSSCSLARVRPDGQSWTTGHRVYPQGEPPNLNSLVSVSGATGDQCVGLFKHREPEALGAHWGGGRGGGGEAQIQPEYAPTATGKRVGKRVSEMRRAGDKWPPGLGAGGASGPTSSEQRNLLILMRRGGARTGEGVSTPRTPPGPPVSSPREPSSKARVQSSPHTCPWWGLSNQSPASLAHTSCHFP